MQGWRTIAINVLTGASILLAGDDILQVVDAKTLLELQAGVNIALRFMTSTAVGKTVPKENL